MDKEITMPDHVMRHRESGLAVSAYCLQNGITYHSMQYWIKKLRGTTPSPLAPKKEMFVELSSLSKDDFTRSPKHFPDHAAPHPQVELTFASGLVVKIYG
jgi:hypothetical protein